MIANPKLPQKMTAEEYLAWEETQELRHEYIDGEIIAMSGASIPHNDIALNFYTALRPHLRQRGCRANVSDVKLQAKQNSRYFYPDLVISCDPQDLQAIKWIENPVIIIEVLSPSTKNYDKTAKLKYYRQIPSLREYVLVDTSEKSIEIFRRGEGKMWLYYQYDGDEMVRLESIDFECALDLIYENIVLEMPESEKGVFDLS